ncbi:hypothetical protein CERZMDRAFT_117465 [Cercospora zeae-maydis SCOH1-5]|uniref:BZIP domain-containing protein n=1 Tax=Cercospora zeae-maydis SCOH1-5 TaxID=717836 RepID=A0A6A6FIM4_9PEZI|nr:hypothetical protein CERZMDRAFT_117465 [Cercospora zeae-maydis SCOH1-5]
MTSRPALKTEQLDMDSFFDFSGTNTGSPTTAASTSRADAMSPFDKEEQQQFNGPSHDYGQFKQQVGLPVGSLANMPQPGMFDGFNSGIDTDFSSGFGWNSGIDMDSEMTMDFNSQPSIFYPTDSPSANFVDPNSIGGQEPARNVGRLWPGMHSQQAQQAAMQKAAQAQALQQRQMKMQAQQAQYRQAANPVQPSQASSQHGKRASHVTEPHVEESISRLLNQMRQNNNTGHSEDAGSPSDVLPHIARMKKDEEEMDEDERLLASEEGKKLSSKERRQLRNKVSARAFRSRRKEYIGQLEGEVAMKVQESNTLRQENQALMQENERYRGLIETLLRHPAFTPFINDISNDPSALINSQIKSRAQQQQQQQAQQQPVHPVSTPQPSQAPQQPHQPQQDMKPDFLNFDASQLQIPQPQPEQQQVNLAAIPEENFSKLNINGYRQPANFNNYNQVNAYSVTSLPRPDPIELLASSPTFFSSSASAAASSTSDSGLAVLLAKLDNAANSIAI